MFAEDEALQQDISSAIENLQLPELTDNPQDSDRTIELPSTPAMHSDPKTESSDKKTEAVIYPTAPSKTSAPTQNVGSLAIDDLDSADKAYVMSIYNRFTASEVSTVSGMLSGGLTVEEKRAIKKIVYAKVSDAEINKLYEIARKYQ